MVTASGLRAFDGLDDDEYSTHELFNVEGEEPEAFAYGTVDVYSLIARGATAIGCMRAVLCGTSTRDRATARAT